MIIFDTNMTKTDLNLKSKSLLPTFLPF